MILYDEIRLVIPGEPRGKARPRVTQYGTYTPKATRDREAYIKKLWQADGAKKIAYPDQGVELEVIAYFPVRKSWSKATRQYLSGKLHTKRPDLDNVVKLVLDALNGGPFPDDGCVAMVLAEKVWTSGPARTEIAIRSLRRGSHADDHD